MRMSTSRAAALQIGNCECGAARAPCCSPACLAITGSRNHTLEYVTLSSETRISERNNDNDSVDGLSMMNVEVIFLTGPKTDKAKERDPTQVMIAEPEPCRPSSIAASCHARVISGVTLAQHPGYLIGDLPTGTTREEEHSKNTTEVGVIASGSAMATVALRRVFLCLFVCAGASLSF